MADIVFYTKVEGDFVEAYFKEGKHTHKMGTLHLRLAEDYIHIWKNALMSMINLIAEAHGSHLGGLESYQGEEAMRAMKREGIE